MSLYGRTLPDARTAEKKSLAVVSTIKNTRVPGERGRKRIDRLRECQLLNKGSGLFVYATAILSLNRPRTLKDSGLI